MFTRTSLSKNGEGYTDPTPYDAVLSKPEPGDVWKFGDRAALVVKAFEVHSAVLTLYDEARPGRVPVLVEYGSTDGDPVRWYVDPQRLNYCLEYNRRGYLGVVRREDFAAALAVVRQELGFDAVEMQAAPQVVTADTEKTIELKEQVDALTVSMKKAGREAEKAKNQLELLQGMYNDLLGRFLARG